MRKGRTSSTTGGCTPRRTFRKLKTKINVEKAVTRAVQMSASNAAPSSVIAAYLRRSGILRGSGWKRFDVTLNMQERTILAKR